ncbi:sugar efflux transporter ['Paenibacillus yunnanensis' Narsing Rao et al. 2020]|uniref:sugar efflux transporter n=1 Tax=Paenibacillus tengchongensis TaxID=2608684 RepID=UPI00124DDD82|nr:sugar efflux transporter [Paenibacillus tengchongensis]
MLTRIHKLFQIPGYTLFTVTMMLQGMAISISSPFLAVYFTTRLGVSAATFGLFTAVTLIAGVGLSSVIARRSDSGLNRKALMVAAMLFNALAYAGYLFIHDFYILLAYMTLFTAIGAPAMPQLFASAREAVNAGNSSDHAFANSFLRSMFSLGFIIGPLAGSVLIRYFGFPGIFISTALIFLINACSLYLRAKPPEAGRRAAVPARQPAKLHHNRSVLIPFIVLILLYSAHWLNNLNISLFIINVLDGSTQNVASVASICALLEIPLMLMLGVLSAKYSNRTLMGWGIVLGGIYYLVVLASTQLWQIIAGQVLLAFFVAVVSAIGISYIQDLLPEQPGYASTLYSNSTTIGRLAGSLVGGAAAEWAGYRHAYWFCVLLFLLAFVLLALPQRAANGKQDSNNVSL